MGLSECHQLSPIRDWHKSWRALNYRTKNEQMCASVTMPGRGLMISADNARFVPIIGTLSKCFHCPATAFC